MDTVSVVNVSGGLFVVLKHNCLFRVWIMSGFSGCIAMEVFSDP